MVLFIPQHQYLCHIYVPYITKIKDLKLYIRPQSTTVILLILYIYSLGSLAATSKIKSIYLSIYLPIYLSIYLYYKLLIQIIYYILSFKDHIKEGQIERVESQVADNQYEVVFILFSNGYCGVSLQLRPLGKGLTSPPKLGKCTCWCNLQQVDCQDNM